MPAWQGPIPLKGSPGAPGLDGTDGEDAYPVPGIPGAPGGPGVAGAPGVAVVGQDGSDGEDGMHIPGNPGAPGATGATGAVGANAPTVPGQDGADGEDGQAIPGSRGVTGTTGALGPAGVSIPCFDGDDGADGQPQPGAIGQTGAQGVPGVSIPCFDGDDGADGQPQPGAIGQTGAQGVPGVSMQVFDGDQGDDGQAIPGNRGVTGTTGALGPVGLSIPCFDGDDGADGSGYPGPVGATGPAGINAPFIPGQDGADGEDGALMPAAVYTAGAGLTLTGLSFAIGAGQVTGAMLVNQAITFAGGTGLSSPGAVNLGATCTYNINTAASLTWSVAQAFVLAGGVTNATQIALTIGANSSGTVAANFGTIIQFNLQDSTTADTAAAAFTLLWVAATHGSTRARAVWQVNDTVARTAVTMEASGTAAMIGFLGASASAQLVSPDLGTLVATFGLASGTPTLAAARLTGPLPAIDGTSLVGVRGMAGLDGDAGEDGFPMPGIPGPRGATGAAGPAGQAIPCLDGDQGDDGFPIPGPPGPLALFNTLTAADVALTDAVPEYNAAAAGNRTVTVARIGGYFDPGQCQARLTLTTAVPITTADVTAATTLYFTPYNGNRVTIYDGTRHVSFVLAEISLSLAGKVPGTYDVFVYSNAGVLTLELIAWNLNTTGAVTAATNATPIVITGTANGLVNDQIVYISGCVGNTAANGIFRVAAQATNAFSLQTLKGVSVAGNGVWTSGGTWYRIDQTTTRPAGNITTGSATDGVIYSNTNTGHRYVGTIQIYQTGQCEDSFNRRHVWNLYNRSRRIMQAAGVTGHTSNNAAYHPWNNDLGVRSELVLGQADTAIVAGISYCDIICSVAASSGLVGVGLDSTSAADGNYGTVRNDNTQVVRGGATGGDWPGVGFHYLQCLEFGNATNLPTFGVVVGYGHYDG